MTLTPAYGRDYKSKAEIKAQFDQCYDFLLDGKPINKPQIAEMGLTSVNIRYKALRSVAVIKVD